MQEVTGSTLPPLQNFREFTATNAVLGETLPQELCIARSGDLLIYYAPFEHVNPSARVVLVGITPGLQQATNALNAFRAAVGQGLDLEAAMKATKVHASFSGPMRRNLVDMLDHFRVNEILHIRSCGELFTTRADLAHFTSTIRYPTFWRGKNYNGTPDPTTHPLLRAYLEDVLAPELALVPGAVVIPLGEKVARTLRYLVTRRLLNPDRVLDGFEHPSGANIERVQYLIGMKPRAELSGQTNPDRLDAARDRILASVEALLTRGP